MDYNIYFDISALLLIVTIALFFFYSGQILNQRNLIYGIMILVTFLAPVFNLITMWADQKVGRVPLWLDYLLNDIYLACGVGIATLFYVYICMISKRGNMVEPKETLRLCALYMIAMALILVVNPFTGCIFYFDETKGYSHGPLFGTLYLIAFLYLIMALIRTIRFRKSLNSWQKLAIFLYSFLNLVVMGVQMYDTKIMALQYSEALGCLAFCFALENPADYKNKWLGGYNVEAFREVFAYANFRKKNYQLLGLRVEGIKEINEMFGTSETVDILKKTVALLNGMGKHNRIFSLHKGDLVVLGQKSRDEWTELQKCLREHFRHSICVHDTQIRLGVSMCMIQHPELIHDADDAIDKLSFGLDTAAQNAEWVVRDADETTYSEGRRESYVVQAMKLAMETEGFEVYFQPIYSAREKRYTRAEALVRLYDEKLGFISPNEFIPLAEKRGMINEIGALVFRGVCEFLQKERLWERGIERVDVNLSAVQCMHEKLAERLIDMMDAYQVPYKAINFEITETAAVASKENLRKNMEKLMEKGVNFSMDDYGSGYSNTMTIIDYPITVVKLDKSMLWSAMEKPKAAQALKYTISMLKEMGLEIIAEGVETGEMATKLIMLGCDLHQGYYYSKPVPEEEFLKIIS